MAAVTDQSIPGVTIEDRTDLYVPDEGFIEDAPVYRVYTAPYYNTNGHGTSDFNVCAAEYEGYDWRVELWYSLYTITEARTLAAMLNAAADWAEQQQGQGT
jgi:hypothetical protein